MVVRVRARKEVENGAAEGAAAVISIRPSDDEPVPDLDLALAQALGDRQDRLLVLRFDDVGVAAYGPWVGPTMEHVSELLDFGRAVHAADPEAEIIVHCHAGRSRSSAVALALLADLHGPGNEEQAVADLMALDVESFFHPNPLIVSMTDAALFRYGRIDAALAATCSRYVKWRAFWREASADPEQHFRESRIARAVRRRSRPDPTMMP